MIRAIRSIGLWFVFGTLTAAGCATASGGHFAGHDIHASARIDGDRARVLVSGPACLLHIDVDGRDDLALYSVARKDGTDADCATGAAVEKKRLRAGAPNMVNLDVAASETICIGPAPGTRVASVMWHARRLDAGSAAGHGPALALEGLGSMTAPALAEHARTVGTLCKYLGLMHGAAPLYRSALRVAEEAREQPAFGEPFARERLATEERAAGADHRDVAIAVAALAALLDAQDWIDEAEPLYRRALRIFGRHPQRDGHEMAVTLSGLAAIRHAKGHPAEAARLYHRALVIRRRLLPAGHPAIAATLHSLAVLYDTQGRHQRAARLIRSAMASEWRAARARRREANA